MSDFVKIPLSKPIITKDMIEAAIQALQNEKLVLGESVYKFEEEFAKFIGVKYAVAVNSGTSALLLAYIALNVVNGVKFITPSATFISTASMGVIAGGRPLFADIDLNTYTIDPRHVYELLREHNDVKVVVPVHLYGYPADLEPLIDMAKEKNIAIIEDCAQAHGALYKGKKVCSWGDVGIFSFYPTKNITVGGDGGMLVTDNEEVANIARKLRDCGRSSKYVHDELGYVFRLNTINAAIGLVQLRYLESWNHRRREIAQLYDKLLSDIEEITTPPKPTPDKTPVYHLYVIRLRDESTRNTLGAWLESHGIQALIHYPVPLHRQPVFRNFARDISLPNTERWAKTVLSLPMYPELTNDEVHYISEKIHEFFEKNVHRDKEWTKRGELWLKRYI